ncbi:Peptidoglycan glycosyltransferase [Verrucomicrobia bacterium]|nr:Peptidoglycan glycosyltransferase [Verrucomicrobiota bacterium]
MARRLQIRRIVGLVVLLTLAFAGLGYRLVDLQVLRHEQLGALAQHNTQREFLLEPRRGDILDAKGNLLATCVLMKAVHADPLLIAPHQVEVAQAIAPLLQMNPADVAQRLALCVQHNDQGQFVTNRDVLLKRRIPVETWQKIHAAMTNLNFGPAEKKWSKTQKNFYSQLRNQSVFARDDQLRAYPNQALAAHVLGFASGEDREIEGKVVQELCGREGIELTLDAKLKGVRGWRRTETDRGNHELVTWREEDVEARHGYNVVLTIDSFLQHELESVLGEAMEKHSPTSISGIVVRPRTGEILALATLPNYDPNNPGAASAEARRNRVVTDVAEPGSTFKIVVVSGALNDGTVRLSDPFDCEHGVFHYAGRYLHDHEPYDVLSVEHIIMKSSNIGAAKIGIKMGPARLYDYIRDYGFGQPTGIPLPGEVVGIVHPLSKWSKVSIAQIPMGQGISVTRLQMMMAMCAIANKGMLMRPMLVDRLEDSDHNVVVKYSPQRVRQVISEPTAKAMVSALKLVVSPEGTAPKAALEHYTVAGKTGTAQEVENGVYVRKYFASFVGFFPADAPELCISIMMDDPKVGYYGGQTAAPAFKQLAERAANYLNIRPEGGEEPSLADPPAPLDTQAVKTAAARSP